MIRLFSLSLLLTGCSGEPYPDAVAGMAMTALIFLPVLLVLAAIAFADRLPAQAEERNCPCEGCKILQARREAQDA